MVLNILKCINTFEACAHTISNCWIFCASVHFLITIGCVYHCNALTCLPLSRVRGKPGFFLERPTIIVLCMEDSERKLVDLCLAVASKLQAYTFEQDAFDVCKKIAAAFDVESSSVEDLDALLTAHKQDNASQFLLAIAGRPEWSRVLTAWKVTVGKRASTASPTSLMRQVTQLLDKMGKTSGLTEQERKSLKASMTNYVMQRAEAEDLATSDVGSAMSVVCDAMSNQFSETMTYMSKEFSVALRIQGAEHEQKLQGMKSTIDDRFKSVAAFLEAASLHTLANSKDDLVLKLMGVPDFRLAVSKQQGMISDLGVAKMFYVDNMLASLVLPAVLTKSSSYLHTIVRATATVTPLVEKSTEPLKAYLAEALGSFRKFHDVTKLANDQMDSKLASYKASVGEIVLMYTSDGIDPKKVSACSTDIKDVYQLSCLQVLTHPVFTKFTLTLNI